MARPRLVKKKPLPRMSRITSPRWAPRATRNPISCVRCTTMVAATP
jgi:hypothetical protein